MADQQPGWRAYLALVALAFATALLTTLPATAQSFPALTGRVVDAANILPPAVETELGGKLAALEVQSQRQLVVATIPDLQGYPIEDYGYRLGRHWGIGDKGRDDGAVLLVAPNAREVRIEVGYGLEPVLTDALSSQIINQSILPRFKTGDYPGGITAGADAIIAQLRLPQEEARTIAAAATRNATAPAGGEQIASWIFWGFAALFFVLPAIMSTLRGGRRLRGRNGAGPVVIWGPGVGSSSGWSGGSSGGSFGGGGFSGGGGGFGGGGSSGSW